VKSKVIILAILFLLTAKTASAATIKINEFYAAGGSSSSNPDWVEIYNEGMDISLYQLIDADNHKKDLSGVICTGHFCTVDWYNLLNKDGDIITLTSKLYPDTFIDQVKYGNYGGISAPGNGQSAGRNPDISGDWIITSSSTKGVSNNTSTPTATATPTPTITPSPSPAPTPSSSFTVTNVPAQINSDQSFNVSVNITPNTAYFCKGAFKKTGSSNYFGLTKVSGNWIKNSSSYTNQYLCTNNFDLEIKPDIDDSGYTGSGDYIFKIGSYDKDGGNLIWSNENIIKINNIDTSDPPIQTTTQIIPSANPANSVSRILASSTPKSNLPLKNTYRIASVAAATASATPEGKVEIKNQKQINPVVWVGLIFIFAGVSSIGYIYIKKNAKIHIPFRR